MTDRELLENAANAAGIPNTGELYALGLKLMDGPHNYWSPLSNDASAFRLAVKLRMSVEPWGNGASAVVTINNRTLVAEPHYGDDPERATRRAIVRAAAALATKD